MDVTDATFQTDVIARSSEVPVVVDLWAPWCGPCTTLGPMLERAVAATDGAVELAKVNVDENPRISEAFAVKSIPAVFAISGGQMVDQFIGALPEAQVTAFIAKLAPAASEADQLVAAATAAAATGAGAGAGDEASLRRALELEPGHVAATEALARVLIDRGEAPEALTVLATVPETPATRALAAEARLLEGGVNVHEAASGELEARLNALLEQVRDDEAARQEFVDLLEALGPEDPRTNAFRRSLAARLF